MQMITKTVTRERPIIFSGEMVRAILEGRKTQTRRIVKPQPEGIEAPEEGFIHLSDDGLLGGRQRYLCGDPENPGVDVEWWEFPVRCPHGIPGDRLWVRETFWQECNVGMTVSEEIVSEWISEAHYEYPGRRRRGNSCGKRPSIHMPRWASRILLEVADIRVERLQGIRETDAMAEGVTPANSEWDACYTDAFIRLWDSINAKRGFGWDVNPWVWVIEFKVVASRGAGGEG
jgi:hypothetical protein